MFSRILIAAVLLFTTAYASAWPRLGRGATPVFENNGDRANGFSVSVTSGTSKLVYSGNDDDREVFFQNLSETYDLHCGTFSAVNDTAGTARWVLRATQDVTTNGTYSVYCIAEDGAGGTSIEITGNVEFDRKDQ